MSEEELVALKRDGFQFGSHNVDHPMMHLPEDEQLRQVRESTEYIVKLLDLEYSCFPFLIWIRSCPRVFRTLGEEVHGSFLRHAEYRPDPRASIPPIQYRTA